MATSKFIRRARLVSGKRYCAGPLLRDPAAAEHTASPRPLHISGSKSGAGSLGSCLDCETSMAPRLLRNVLCASRRASKTPKSRTVYAPAFATRSPIKFRHFRRSSSIARTQASVAPDPVTPARQAT